MRHEKIVKYDNFSIRITAVLRMTFDEVYFAKKIAYRKKNGKIWKDMIEYFIDNNLPTDSATYEEFKERNDLQKHILAAKLELWEKIKPNN